MSIQLGEVFDKYPNPFFVIRPIVQNSEADDFEYIYVNDTFSLLVGKNREELMGRTFQQCFQQDGERVWLDLFRDAAKDKKHMRVDCSSYVIQKRMVAELFYVAPDRCGCIIFDAQNIYDDMPKTSDTRYSDDELQHRANYDYLTGVYNRHYLNEICGEINKKHNIGITFVDINGLKTTNDTLGHLAGDKLIKRVSNIICSVYESSMVFRIGGDEFVIITTGVDEKTFKEMSEKGRKIFEGENLAAMGCQFYEKIDDISCCIEHCDFLMYEHKKAMKQYAYANA